MRSPRAAFTLLEVLLAMTLMSMLAATLYASLHIAFSARDSVQAALDEANAGELGLDLLRRDFCQALPPRGILAGAFTGTDGQWENATDADSMSFYASSNSPAADELACDVVHVEYSLGTDDDGRLALVRNTTTNLLAAETPEPLTEVICRNVRSLNLRYYDGVDWVDAWDSTQYGDGLPLAVEVLLELRPGRRVSPDNPYADDQGALLARVLVAPCAVLPEGTTVLLPSTDR